MANLKAFLIPVRVAMAGLATATSQATAAAQASALEAQSDQLATSLSALARNEAKRVLFAQGDDLHSLLGARNPQGIILSAHDSHAAYASQIGLLQPRSGG